VNKKSIFLNIIIFLIFSYFLVENINFNEFVKILKNIEIINLFIIFLLFLIRPFLITLRWYILINNYTSISFLTFLKNIIVGTFLNYFTSTSIALDVTKLLKINKEVGFNKGFFLLLIDKYYTLIFKLCFLIITFNLFNYFILKFHLTKIIIISISIILFTLIFKNKLLELFIKFLNFIKKNSINKLDDVLRVGNEQFKKIGYINIIIQFLDIYLYIKIFDAIGTKINIFEIVVLAPLIDFIAQFQFLIIGLKEFSFVYFSQFFNLTFEEGLSGGLIHTFSELTSMFVLFITFNIFQLNVNNFELNRILRKLVENRINNLIFFNIISKIRYYSGYPFYIISKIFKSEYIGGYLFSDQEAGRGRQKIIKDTLLKINKENISILEIGVYCGQTTIMIGKTLTKNKKKFEITCVDVWEAFENTTDKNIFMHNKMIQDLKNNKIFDLFINNLKANNLFEKCNIKKQNSDNFFDENEKKFDLIIIDASHLFENVKRDILNSQNILHNFGFIIGDDYEINSSEIELATLEKLAKKNVDIFYDEKTKKRFHPGVTFAVDKIFGKLKSKNGLFCVQKMDNKYLDKFS
jgi:uncharacterized membrane protein YbhN (UPF0104 family)